MASFKQWSCRLCLKNITDKGFQIIDDAARNILDTLLLQLTYNGGMTEIMCDACNSKLNGAFVFKLTCLNTNITIIPHVNSEMLELDLQEVYTKENGSGHLMDISYNSKICRLCLQLIKGEIKCVGQEELEAIHKFVPEMNIKIKDPVVCKPCFDSLCTHNTFLKDCFEVEQKVRDICESSVRESRTDTFSALFVKTENLDKELEINEMEMAIKTECIDIKLEEDKGGSCTLLLSSGNEIFENNEIEDAEEEDHKVYKCETCEYTTKKKRLLRTHILRHKNLLEVQMYKCNACDFESRHKDDVIKHQWVHEEVQIYRCNDCNYQSKYRRSIVRHVRLHKSPSQVYKCHVCDYEFRHNKNLIAHQLLHLDPSLVRMYKCEICNFETKYKRSLRSHRLKHRRELQIS